MASREVLRAALRLGILVVAEELRKMLALMLKRKKRRYWVRKWIARRNTLGAGTRSMEELAAGDDGFLNMMRMKKERFDVLCEMIAGKIQKQNTVMRQAIPAKLKLQITLRFLATGDSLASMQYLFRVPKSTISIFLPEVVDAIYEALKGFIKTPSTEAEWQEVERGFADKWNFPGCVGALDGKHIVMKKPAHGGSMLYSYKGALSVILMAVVDSDYSFRYIDVGASGRSSDGGVFQNCSLKEAVDSKSLNMPDGCFFVADDAFPMKTYLLKPFLRNTPLTSKELVFNYRLSRARLIVENAFGILASRFRVFEKPISLGPEKVNKVVLATCALHNWLKMSTRSHYLPPGSVDVEDIKTGTIIPGSWRQIVTEGSALRDIERLGSNNYSKQAAARRYDYASYFMSEGVVPWQMQMIHSRTLNQ